MATRWLTPELVGAMNLELPGHEWMDRAVVIAVGGSGEAPTPPRVQIVLPHQPPQLLGVDDDASRKRRDDSAHATGRAG
jgi:hypothetical protein